MKLMSTFVFLRSLRSSDLLSLRGMLQSDSDDVEVCLYTCRRVFVVHAACVHTHVSLTLPDVVLTRRCPAPSLRIV